MMGFVTGIYLSRWLHLLQNGLAIAGCILGFGYSLFFRYEGMWVTSYRKTLPTLAADI